ncbi:MAG: Minf_1886 family protein [Pirellulales bacterium]
MNSWGVTCTSDFGSIVFNLIEIGQMRKTDADRREDFDDVFDFNREFVEDYEITLPES